MRSSKESSTIHYNAVLIGIDPENVPEEVENELLVLSESQLHRNAENLRRLDAQLRWERAKEPQTEQTASTDVIRVESSSIKPVDPDTELTKAECMQLTQLHNLTTDNGMIAEMIRYLSAKMNPKGAKKYLKSLKDDVETACFNEDDDGDHIGDFMPEYAYQAAFSIDKLWGLVKYCSLRNPVDVTSTRLPEGFIPNQATIDKLFDQFFNWYRASNDAPQDTPEGEVQE